MVEKGLKYIIALLLLPTLFSCSGGTSPDLNAGVVRNSFKVNHNPNPYYHQQPVYNQVPGYMPYVQNAAPPAKYYYQQPPVYQQRYAPYNGPAASRFYSNPYAIPPSQQYQRYDADQYYVPPTRYNNVEPGYGDNRNTGWGGSADDSSI